VPYRTSTCPHLARAAHATGGRRHEGTANRILGTHRLEIVFNTTLEEARRRIPRWVGEPEQIEEGVLLRAHADDLDAAARMLASLGWPFTVREPDELRRAIRRVADVLAEAAAG
jgi:predicted DNA-binding transcriptional regulator YafY